MMNKFSFDLDQAPLQEAFRNDGNYVLTQSLKAAVEVAVRLGQPLLLTGEPGTGKSRLAYKIAHDLLQDPNTASHTYPKPLVFKVKTTSVAKDLFYRYDALTHFYDANIRKAEQREAPDIRNYIELNALGEGIARTLPQEDTIRGLLKEPSREPQHSVVLIDEIDKAPRDFPNDILNEIDENVFHIPEMGHLEINRSDQRRIILILTSNSEKNLPEAFLRRCVFFHIPFPEDSAALLRIVQSQLSDNSQYADEQLIKHFLKIREAVNEKKPTTAELLAWLRILEVEGFAWSSELGLKKLSPSQKQLLRHSYSVLAKTRRDLEEIERSIYPLTA